ncbi:MAG: hypothetical protein QXG50_04920 [Desulfurococcaceae archaeon]
MFHYIAIMGFGDKPLRQLRLLAKLIYNIDRDGLNMSLEELVSRSNRFGELKTHLEILFEALLVEK